MKKTITLITLAAMLLLCSCDVVTPTLTPTPEPDSSTVLTTIVPTPTPTPTPVVIPTENLLPCPKINHLFFLSGTHFASPVLEVWDSNNEESSGKYLNLNFIIPNEQGEFYDKLGTSDYEYTWLLGYHNAKISPVKEEDIVGFYSVTPKGTFTKKEGETIYRLSVADSPEGDFTEYLETGEVYLFLIVILKNGEPIASTYQSCVWTEEHATIRDNFYASKS